MTNGTNVTISAANPPLFVVSCNATYELKSKTNYKANLNLTYDGRVYETYELKSETTYEAKYDYEKRLVEET